MIGGLVMKAKIDRPMGNKASKRSELVSEQVHPALVSVLKWSTSIVIAVCICPVPIVAVRDCLATVCSCELQFEALQLIVSAILHLSAAVRRHCFVRRPLDLVRLFTRRPTPPVLSSDSSPRSATRRFFVRCEQACVAHAPPSGHRKVTATPS
ncbi:hypothetical protein LR48_Vigan05g112200 [Vigna angularis]|uniref:Uncharacterized protein n=1 Tax=Phaseolus angularis TaxID=3914 RepID=A0A0L9ULA1_PHAAN|nr:hypothetical protein LR48_Vigan05g112200 [Vigna angularis]